MKSTAPSYLKHHFLIAMPHMDDPNFAQTVTYLVEHNEQGAMGLVINRPNGLSLSDVLEQLRPEVDPPARCQTLPIYAGGPVQTDRGFVLHPSGLTFQGVGEPPWSWANWRSPPPRTCSSPSPKARARKRA